MFEQEFHSPLNWNVRATGSLIHPAITFEPRSRFGNDPITVNPWILLKPWRRRQLQLGHFVVSQRITSIGD